MTNGISPKLVLAVIAAVIGYLLAQPVLELPPIATVALQALLVAIAAYRAPAGSVASATATSSDERLPAGTLDQLQ